MAITQLLLEKRHGSYAWLPIILKEIFFGQFKVNYHSSVDLYVPTILYPLVHGSIPSTSQRRGETNTRATSGTRPEGRRSDTIAEGGLRPVQRPS